jgi:cold shock CspA family protein
MRHKGNIVEWHKARGFGFIEPDTGEINGDERIFCPIEAFQTRMPYPTSGLPVNFEVVRDERGRWCAAKVIQEGASLPRQSKPAAAAVARPRRSPVAWALRLAAWGLVLLAVIGIAALAWQMLRK